MLSNKCVFEAKSVFLPLRSYVQGDYVLTMMWLCVLFLSVQLQKAESSEADEADEELAVVHSAKVYAPKSLVLVSRLDYTEVFRV